MARRKSVEPSTMWTVLIPDSISKPIELLLMDPTRGRTKYSAKSALVTALLKEWLDKQRAEHSADPTDSHTDSHTDSPL